jgi:hypothetical protein
LATSCTATSYAFHPMYSTSSQHTRVPWSAHSYNIAFSDEIGHWEYCDKINSSGTCIVAGVSDPSGLDSDDVSCSPAGSSLLVKVTGCQASDTDFDGVCYQKVWPGAVVGTASQLYKKEPHPIIFSSPLFVPAGGSVAQDYDQVAFEADLPRIESSCDRSTGSGCVNPPPGAKFYPFFTTNNATPGRCRWQLGGNFNPNTDLKFGGNSTVEFGSLLKLVYPGVGGPITRFNDFRKILANNPCPQNGP